MDRHPLLIVARELGYPKLERLAAWTNSNFEKANDLIQASVRTERAILFFPGAMFEVSPFGSIHRYFLLKADARDDNYLLFGPNLDEKYLRRLFTGIELIVFKLYHIACTSSNPNVHFEQFKTKQLLNRLRTILNLQNWAEYIEIFDELFFVRNAFVHPFVGLENITYRGVRLRDCFGDSYLGHSYDLDSDDVRKFTDDVRAFVKPLIENFCRFQLEQIDKEKLFRLCNSILKARSLN
jgi:hypothetical protein